MVFGTGAEMLICIGNISFFKGLKKGGCKLGPDRLNVKIFHDLCYQG